MRSPQDQGVTCADAGDQSEEQAWRVRGRRGSKPRQESPSGTSAKTSPTQPAWIKSITASKKLRSVKIAKQSRSSPALKTPSSAAKGVLHQETETGRTPRGHAAERHDMLAPWKMYLDSRATYNAFFDKRFLRDVKEGSSVMNGRCNAGITRTNKRGMREDFQVWLNEHGIANLLSITMLEKAGYKVSMHTDIDWVVTNPQGENIIIKRDTGICGGMPFLNLRSHKKTGVAMIERVRENYRNYTEGEITKANMARKTQARISNPPDERYKEIVSGRSLKHCLVTVMDISNAHAIFGPNHARLKGAATRQPVRFTKIMG